MIKLVKVFPANTKSINRIQKYPDITESYACILKVFVTTIDSSINISIYILIYILVNILINILSINILEYVQL